MNDHEFQDFVSDDVKRRLTEEESASLRDPETLDRWRTALVELDMKSSTHLSVAHKNIALAILDDDQERLAELYEQEAGTKGFRRRLTTVLRESKILLAERDAGTDLGKAHRLVRALISELMVEAEYTHEDIDAMWDDLDDDVKSVFFRLRGEVMKALDKPRSIASVG